MNNKIVIVTIFVIFLLVRIMLLDVPGNFEEIKLGVDTSNKLLFRILSILIGLFSASIFLKFINPYKNNLSLKRGDSAKFIFICLILLIFSPWLIQTNIFSFQNSLALLVFLTSLIFFRNNKLIFLIPLLILIIFNFKNSISLINQSVIYDITPRNFLWQVDRRLAFDRVEGYNHDLGQLDTNRFVHNKPTYILNNGFSSIISPFDLEKISSPLQAHSPASLEISNSSKLPKVFFFELPIILIGFISLLNKKLNVLRSFFVTLIWATIFYKSNLALSLLLPFLILFEGVGLFYIYKNLRKIFFSFIVLLFIFAHLSFFDLVKFHPHVWMGNEDLAEWQLWKNLNQDLNNYPKVTVTDRLGNPEGYMKYYLNDDQINDLNLKIGSFKYLESDRREGELWIGLPGEFVGQSGDFKKETEIDNGLILEKIKNIKQPDKTFGEELWLVETKLNK